MTLSLQILVFIALIISLAKVVGGLAGRFGFPVVLGELLAGLILGPTLLNIWGFSFLAPQTVGPEHLGVSLPGIVKVFAELGVVVLMFLAGLETDVVMMRVAAGSAFWAACGGVVLPLVGGATVSRMAGFGWGEAIFIGTVLTATSVSITAQTLLNLNELRSKAGSTILGAAVIDDVLGLLVLSIVIAWEPHTPQAAGSTWAAIGLTVVRIAGFLAFALLLGPRLVRFTFRRARHFHGPHTAVAVAICLAFVFAFLSEYFGGMASITGSYLAGIFIASSPAHGEIIGDLRAMTNSFFGPLFFVSIGLEINAWQAGGRWGFFLLILTVAILGKIVGCGLGAWATGFKPRESMIVGVGMVPRGEVGLITASIGWAAGLISPVVYSLMVVLVLATTLFTPAVLRAFYRRPGSLQEKATDPLIAEFPHSK